MTLNGEWRRLTVMHGSTVLDVASLVAATRAGARPKFLFFWGHKAQVAGRVGKWCLSQWWPASFSVEGRHYATAEHYMMAEKARLFGDESVRARILAAPSPAAAKRLGREVRGFDEARWVAARTAIVTAGSRAKFLQHPALRDFLLGTKERVLVEASPADRIWGIGLAEDDPRAMQPVQWRGLNLLGFALMAARAALREGSG